MSSNDVTIIAFRDGSMSLNGFALDLEEVAALRAHFAAEFEAENEQLANSGLANGVLAAERMPEDVQKLVEEVKRLVREGDRRLRFQLAAKGDQAWADQMLDAIQRLEAAYSKGVE